MPTVLIYLDSNDYSVLSDSARTSAENLASLNKLREWARQGAIKFGYSGIHLSEMAPVQAKFSRLASQRIDLMIELCGLNALVSPENISKHELLNLKNRTHTPFTTLSDVGAWYPDGVADVFTDDPIDMTTEVLRALKSHPTNRKQWRFAKRRISKGLKAKTDFKLDLIQNSRSLGLANLLEKYSMREEDARICARYVAGDATAAQANAAFAGTLRDPRHMIRWFEHHHEKLHSLIDWTRGPAANMLAEILKLAYTSKEARRLDIQFGGSLSEELFSYKSWKRQEDKILLGVVTKLGQEFKIVTTDVNVREVDEYCPGISSSVRSLHSAWFGSMHPQWGKPRPPLASDFVDGVHAMYAPYVNIFRADSFMAPHVSKRIKNLGVTVVPKLSSLTSAIEHHLRIQA